MGTATRLAIGLVVGFIVAEALAAAFAYFGIDVGASVIRLIDKSYDASKSPRSFEDDVYLSANRSPVPLANRDIIEELLSEGHSCIAFAGLGGEQALINMYTLRFRSLGLPPPNTSAANCLEVDIGTLMKEGKPTKATALFIRLVDGPTCRFGLCSTDVWFLWEGKLVLSIRAHKIGIAATTTNGLADLVADDYYLFVWSGEKYVPRYF